MLYSMLMGQESKKIGDSGEAVACEYLKELGWEIIERNFRSNKGEVDIIAKDRGLLVFVEVKNYSHRSFYLPSFSIDRNKKECIIKTAKYYLYKNRISGVNCRFDAITIYKSFDGRSKTEHFRNAFESR